MKSNTLVEILDDNYNKLSDIEKTIYSLYHSETESDQLIVNSYFKQKPYLKDSFKFLDHLAQVVNTSPNNS